MRNGFTIVELLIALVVFVVLAFFATQSLSNILQTKNKAEVTRQVRQEADYAIGVVERHLRGAQGATCTSPTLLNYVDIDGKTGSFACVNPGTSNSYIASSSARLTTTETIIPTCSFSCPTPSQVELDFVIQQAKTTNNFREKASLSVTSQIILRNQ